MTRRVTGTLFWKFAGIFLLVVVLTILLQGIGIAVFVRPLAERWARDRAELRLSDAATAIETLPATATDTDVETLLHTWSDPPLLLFLERADGRRLRPRDPDDPDARTWRDRDGPRDPDAGPRPARPRGRRFRPDVIARRALGETSAIQGELIAVGARGHELLADSAPFRGLFLLPMAVLLAGGFSLFLFRLLTRRLRLLEELATRVAEGDLSTRVTAVGDDEIGRLGERLNYMTERLADARQNVERQTRQRNRLLADISHELATPLTSIRGYAETLLDSSVVKSDEDRTRYVETILDESQRLDALISELFELTRLEAGAQPLTVESIDVLALVRNTVDRYADRFRVAGVTLACEPGTDVAPIQGDGRRLEQVVENLLTNALRYVPNGGQVNVSVVATNGSVSITVSDDGPGFDEADVPHVFDRFYRGDRARSTPGSGLGLAIVQEIVRQHGGQASASNGPAGGAVLSVTLPVAGPAPPRT